MCLSLASAWSAVLLPAEAEEEPDLAWVGFLPKFLTGLAEAAVALLFGNLQDFRLKKLQEESPGISQLVSGWEKRGGKTQGSKEEGLFCAEAIRADRTLN